MPPWNFKCSFAAISLAAAFAVAPGQSGLAIERVETAPSEPAGESPEEKPKERLSATEFFTMAPFVIPIIENGEHTKQFVLIVAIALGEAGDRDELRHLSPRMRNAIYQLLFKMVSFRTVEPRIPPKKVLRTKLTKLIRRVAGAEMIESLIIHVAKITEIQK